MGYSKETYALATRTMQKRRLNSAKELDLKRHSLYVKYPRAEEIETELAKTATSVGRAVLNGGDIKKELLRLRDSNLKLQQELNNILKEANLPQNYLDEKFLCEKCEDKGNIDGIMCECFKSLLKEIACKQLNSLSPLAISSFDSISFDYQSAVAEDGSNISPRKQLESIVKYCKNYAETFSKDSNSLFLQGDTGLGKTHISLAIAGVITNLGYGVVYCSAPDILSHIEREHFSKDGNEAETLEQLRNCDLLIIDDLGTEFSTQFTSATMYNLFNSRILAGKPTIINTNLTFADLNNFYSERIVSRIVGNCQRIIFKGKDVRFIKK